MTGGCPRDDRSERETKKYDRELEMEFAERTTVVKLTAVIFLPLKSLPSVVCVQ
jgi:hypothetical protein